MKTLRKVSVFSLACFQAVLFALTGLLSGTLIFLFSKQLHRLSEAVGTDLSRLPDFGLGLGTSLLLLLPLAFALAGFLAGLLGGLLFNLVAALTGGIRVRIDD
jgi:hypothetical protein